MQLVLWLFFMFLHIGWFSFLVLEPGFFGNIVLLLVCLVFVFSKPSLSTENKSFLGGCECSVGTCVVSLVCLVTRVSFIIWGGG